MHARNYITLLTSGEPCPQQADPGDAQEWDPKQGFPTEAPQSPEFPSYKLKSLSGFCVDPRSRRLFAARFGGSAWMIQVCKCHDAYIVYSTCTTLCIYVYTRPWQASSRSLSDSECAKEHRLRRLCQKRKNGSCAVPEHIHEAWRKGGPEKEALIARLDELGWDRVSWLHLQ